MTRTIVGPRRRVFVAVDWTDLHDGVHQALVAGIVTRSRALPIWWQVVAKTSLTANQNRIEERFVKVLRHILPPACEAALLADRGFCRVTFLKWLETLGYKYIIRTQANVWVEGEPYVGTPDRLKIQPGTLFDLGVVRYQKKVAWPCRVIVRFWAGQAEPWFLTTNLGSERAEQVADWYARRMEI